jgi:hypothetical protein
MPDMLFSPDIPLMPDITSLLPVLLMCFSPDIPLMPPCSAATTAPAILRDKMATIIVDLVFISFLQ